MTKNLKLQVKNPQIAEAINLRGLKAKLAKKKTDTAEEGESVHAGQEKPEEQKREEKNIRKKSSTISGETTEEKKKKTRGKSKIELESPLVENESAPLDKISTDLKEPSALPAKGKQLSADVLEKKELPEAPVYAKLSKPHELQEKKEKELKRLEEAKAKQAEELQKAAVDSTATEISTQLPVEVVEKKNSRENQIKEDQKVYTEQEVLKKEPTQPASSEKKGTETSQQQRPSTSSFQPSKEYVHPAPRQDSARQQISSQTHQHRPDYRTQPPRGESFRRPEAPRRDTGRYDTPRSDTRYDAPRGDAPRGDAPRGDGYRPAPRAGMGHDMQSSRPGVSTRGQGGFKPVPFRERPLPQYQSTQGSERQTPTPTVRPSSSFQAPPRRREEMPNTAPATQPPRREGPPRSSTQPIRSQPPQQASFEKITEAPVRDYEDIASRKQKGKGKEERVEGKSVKRQEVKEFDARHRHGFHGDEEESWRKKRPSKAFKPIVEQEIVRPTKIKVRLPISVKDLASEMKLKASELISKLFLQGVIVTLNDLLDDETVVGLLGHDFGCEVTVDTSEDERIRITDKSIKDEIASCDQTKVTLRPPVVAFMGHVDHGKTSLIDAIRKSNRAMQEVGAITQHIGAFTSSTPHGRITILDTPGHEAFSHMRERGAEVTDIVVLVIAGDEGIQVQTEEAIRQAQKANATIIVAINKCDKPAFNAENVYRQLAERNLLPEAWGGQTITINCSAVSGQGISELLEMIALQSEILELKGCPSFRARGTVIESQMHKGLGQVATVLVQNGTLHVGDSLVFGMQWARIKTMKDENGKDLPEAGPSTPVLINGLSDLPEAGEEFIVVKSEKEAREIAEVRKEGRRQVSFQVKKRLSIENLMENAAVGFVAKEYNLIVRADVQGSLEALKVALEKIDSKKVKLNIISSGIGEISESDVQLAYASKAGILGFHTQVETHVQPLIKELGVVVRLHDIIYHAVDYVKEIMKASLDKIPQEQEKGKAEVKAIFKSSQLGAIAGCQVIEGVILRNCQIRVRRDNQVVWKGAIASLKRVKEDVREVQKGFECGILLQGFTDLRQGDILEAFEIIYLEQEL